MKIKLFWGYLIKCICSLIKKKCQQKTSFLHCNMTPWDNLKILKPECYRLAFNVVYWVPTVEDLPACALTSFSQGHMGQD